LLRIAFEAGAREFDAGAFWTAHKRSAGVRSRHGLRQLRTKAAELVAERRAMREELEGLKRYENAVPFRSPNRGHPGHRRPS
jgi:hypothetical protein